MADLAVSAVVIERAWNEGGPAGKMVQCREVTLTLTGQGSLTNKIPANVMELTKIEQALAFRTSADKLIIAGPSYDGVNLVLFDVQNATDASRDDPADFTATVRGVVKGYQ
jgi:hypothetical protein